MRKDQIQSSTTIDAYRPEFIDGLHDAQIEVLDCFDDSIWLENGKSESKFPVQYYDLEWHRRARKTTLALSILNKECIRVPNAKYTYIAPTQVMTREIAWDDPYMIKSIVPDGIAKFNEQKMTVFYKNGSILKLGGADIIDPHKKRGVDTVGLVLDEAALIPEEVWTMIYRPIIAGDLRPELAKVTRRWVMFLYTPKGINWVTRHFDEAACIASGGTLPVRGKAAKLKDGFFASRLDAELSGVISDRGLSEAKADMPLEMYDQEFRCARITEEQKSIITSSALDKLRNVRRIPAEIRRFISCDPSLGGDECVVYVWENSRIIDAMYIHERNQKIIAGEIQILGLRHNAKYVVVDEVGIGGEICSRLREMGLNVIGFNSASEANDKDRFANLKIEAWWQARNKCAELMVEYPEDEVLRMQITAVRYNITATGKLICELKEKTKKTLGHSPDRADAWIMGLWVMPKVEPIKDSGNNVRQSGVIRPSYAC